MMRLTVHEHEVTLPSGRVIRPLSVRCPECGGWTGFDRTDADRRKACLMPHGTLGWSCPGGGRRVSLRWPSLRPVR